MTGSDLPTPPPAIKVAALGFGRIAGLVFAVVLVVGIAAWAAVSELRHQVGIWGAIESVDGARETVFAANAAYTADPSPEAREDMLAAFATLQGALDTLRSEAGRHDHFEGEMRLSDLAFTEFAETEAAREAATAALLGLKSDLKAVEALTGEAQTDTQIAMQKAQRDMLEHARHHKRAVAELRDHFERSLMIDAIRSGFVTLQRMEPGTTAELVTRARLRSKADDLGRPCSGDASGACTPSPIRVRDAFRGFLNATPFTVEAEIEKTRLAVEAFLAAAGRRHTSLSARIEQEALAERDARERFAGLRQREVALTRIARANLDLRATLEGAASGNLRGLEELDRGVRTRLNQVRLRAPGLAMGPLGDRQLADDLLSRTAQLEVAWPGTLDRIAALEDLKARFDRDMGELANVISRDAARVRETSNTWIAYFSTATIAVLGAAMLAIGAVILFAYRTIGRPLGQVTADILQLAEGGIDRAFSLEAGGKGLRDLSFAVEKLRLRMIERRDLALENGIKSEQLAEQVRIANHLALHDTLTGLPNRSAIEQRLAALAPEDGQRTIIRINLDDFGNINDTMGHATGDRVLCHVTEILREGVTEEDFVARIGGDEFVILLGPERGEADGWELAARLLASLTRDIRVDGQICRVGAAFGIASAQEGLLRNPDLLVSADAALALSKRTGRNAITLYTPEIHSGVLSRRQTAVEIQRAIENEEFVPYFQPQVDARDHHLRGVETLVRWMHPERGLLTPSSFLPVAEQLSLTPEIDRIVVRKALMAVADLHSRGIALPKVSFNIGTSQIFDTELSRLARDLNLGDTLISLEILENVLIEDQSDAFHDRVVALRREGFSIELDDFGSGHASIIGLMRLAPDTMKLDQRLIFPLSSSPQAMNLVRSLCDIGKTLGIKITAEGVETADHARILRNLGCRTLQGYHFARPMTAEGLSDAISTGFFDRLHPSFLGKDVPVN